MPKTELNGLTLDEIKVKRDECKKTIAELEQRCKEMDEKLFYDDLNEKLARVMDKWVKVKGFDSWDEIDDNPDGYRVFKVVGVTDWISNNEFHIDIDQGVYIGTVKINCSNKRTCAYAPRPDIVYIGNVDSYKTGDITKWEVITEKKAKSLIKKALDNITKHINKALVR